jgi:mannose-1-phosphate guanylyltransferase/mannose-6-phosphate isomerase
LDETPPQTLAALATVQNAKKPVLLLSPAEQTIAKASALTAALQQAIAQVEQGSIVILGVPRTLINL